MASRKRGNNEGTLRYLDSKKLWEARFTVENEMGVRKQHSVYGKTRQEANQKMLATKREAEAGRIGPARKQTVSAYLDEWLRTLNAADKCRPKTLRIYEQIVRVHLKPTLGPVVLERLSAQQIEAMLSDRRRSGLSDATVQRIRDVLRNALNRAVRLRLIAENAASAAECRCPSRRDIQPYTIAEANVLLEALYVVGIYLGLRMSELLGLRWSDIDFDAGIIRPTYQLDAVTRKLAPLKTEGSRAPLPMPGVVAQALLARKSQQIEEMIRLGADSWENDLELVFTTGFGTPYGQRNLLRHFKATIAKASLRDIRFHDLRHTTGSLLLAMGVPIEIISKVLRHTDLRTTANIYAHANTQLMGAAIGKLETAFANAPKANSQAG